MQSLNFVYGIFNFEMYSFVINIDIDVNKALEEVNTIPMLGFISDIVEVPMVDPDAISISVIINNTFFFLKIYISFHNIHYQF